MVSKGIERDFWDDRMITASRRVFFSLCIVVSIFMMSNTQVYAEILPLPSDFEHLGGKGQYLNKNYRTNYHLDLEETGLLNAGSASINMMANIVFSLYLLIAKVTIIIFYYAMDFDIAAMFSSQINGIQQALNNSIFRPMFVLAFLGTGILLIKRLLWRDVAGSAGDIMKIILITMASYLMTSNSAQMLSAATGITKEASLYAITGMNEGAYSSASFGSNVAGALWGSLIHDPYIALQFGNYEPSESEIQDFLSQHPRNDGRKELVKNFHTPEVFSIDRVTERIGLTLFLFIPFLVKAAVYIAVSLIQLLFQMLAVFFLLLAPIVLLLAMTPLYGGVDLITRWLKKILETQISIVFMTLIVGLIVKFDALTYGLAPKFGWLVVMIFQAVIAAGVVFGHKQILSGLTGLAQGIHNPKLFSRRFIRTGDVFGTTSKGIKDLPKNVKTAEQFANNISKKAQASTSSIMATKTQLLQKGSESLQRISSTFTSNPNLYAYNGMQKNGQGGDNPDPPPTPPTTPPISPTPSSPAMPSADTEQFTVEQGAKFLEGLKVKQPTKNPGYYESINRATGELSRPVTTQRPTVEKQLSQMRQTGIRRPQDFTRRNLYEELKAINSLPENITSRPKTTDRPITQEQATSPKVNNPISTISDNKAKAEKSNITSLNTRKTTTHAETSGRSIEAKMASSMVNISAMNTRMQADVQSEKTEREVERPSTINRKREDQQHNSTKIPVAEVRTASPVGTASAMAAQLQSDIQPINTQKEVEHPSTMNRKGERQQHSTKISVAETRMEVASTMNAQIRADMQSEKTEIDRPSTTDLKSEVQQPVIEIPLSTNEMEVQANISSSTISVPKLQTAHSENKIELTTMNSNDVSSISSTEEIKTPIKNSTTKVKNQTNSHTETKKAITKKGSYTTSVPIAERITPYNTQETATERPTTTSTVITNNKSEQALKKPSERTIADMQKNAANARASKKPDMMKEEVNPKRKHIAIDAQHKKFSSQYGLRKRNE